MRVLAGEELTRALAGAPGWALSGEMLTRTFRFGNFPEAIRFVNGAAAIAEELGHHPDLDIRYNRVTARLTTHDSEGLTELDFRLASRLDQLRDGSAE